MLLANLASRSVTMTKSFMTLTPGLLGLDPTHPVVGEGVAAGADKLEADGAGGEPF